MDIVGESGRSARTRLRRDSVQESAWLAEVLDALHIERAHVAGLSLGGWMTLAFAAYHPERVMKIVAMCPAPFIRLRWKFMLYGIRASLHPTTRAVRAMVDYMTTSPKVDRDEMTAMMLNIMRYRRPYMSRPRVLSESQLRQIQAPTLFLVGANEDIYDAASAAAYAARILPSVRTCIIPEAGHALNIEQPALINDLVLEFLTESDSFSPLSPS